MGKTAKEMPSGRSKNGGFDRKQKFRIRDQKEASNQEHILQDERFSRIATDPRFRGIPKEEKKVRIDSRFNAMFTDKRFNQKHSVDKRGRPVNFASSDNLEKFYQLNDKEKLNDGKGETGPDEGRLKRTGEDLDDRFQARGSFVADDETSESEASDAKDQQDFSRGVGNLSSSSSESEDESEDEGPEKGEIEHPWAELSADAPPTDDATRRLGLVNIDWDSIRAEDIFMVLNSFKPADGVIKSISIYPSEFGLQRSKEEDLSGPTELKNASKIDSDVDDDLDEDEDPKAANERLRQYQLNRLKYYYAVIECDSPETANKIYEECDGLEYENSSAALDLRFIPDDMEFGHEPKSTISSLPANYKPSEFVISALQQSRVKCSWDETARDRKPLTVNEWEKVDDLQAYLASSSSEEEEEFADDEQAEMADTRSVMSSKDPESISRYRSLLLKMDKKNAEQFKDEEDVDMETHWEPDVGTAAKTTVKMKQKEDALAKMTPFEKLLEKQKDKRKAKRQSKRDDSPDLETAWNEEESDDLEGSSDGESEQNEGSDHDEKITKGRKRKANSVGADGQPSATADLELLMGEEDNNRHFSLKTLLTDAKETKAQKRKQKKLLKKSKGVAAEKASDDFAMDLEDPRFKTLFTSKDFNIDISDPSFKKTKAMESVIQEKLKRKQTGKKDDGGTSLKNDEPKLRPALATLAKSVKAKARSEKMKTTKS